MLARGKFFLFIDKTLSSRIRKEQSNDSWFFLKKKYEFNMHVDILLCLLFLIDSIPVD